MTTTATTLEELILAHLTRLLSTASTALSSLELDESNVQFVQGVIEEDSLERDDKLEAILGILELEVDREHRAWSCL